MKYVIKVLGLMFCLLLFGCSNKVDDTKEEIMLNRISTKKVHEMIDNEDIFIIDVRDKDEYSQGHLKNSLLVPYNEIEEVEDIVLDKDAMIILYCRSGRRSSIAGSVLVDMGYTNVHDMGGILSWKYDIVK